MIPNPSTDEHGQDKNKDLSSSLSIYSKLNNSYREKLVFRFGDSAGFFSEYNNMILAVLYCLDKKKMFTLYTPPDGSLAIRDGWNDYFMPFCEQTTKEYNKILNKRIPNGKIATIDKMKNAFHKHRDGFKYYTYELWNDFRSSPFINKHFNIPELSIKGDLISATGALIKILWQYNDSFGEAVTKKIASFNLPSSYVGIHVRGGDKIVEAKIFSPDEYMSLVKENSSQRDVFVLTDDYRYYEYLVANYKDYRFITSCREDERGYDFSAFLKLSKQSQKREYIKLLASMDIMRGASLSFGTRTSNPGMFLGMCMGNGFIGIDNKDWIVT